MWSIPRAQNFGAKKFDVSQFDKLLLNSWSGSESSGARCLERKKHFQEWIFGWPSFSITSTFAIICLRHWSKSFFFDYREKLRNGIIWRRKPYERKLEKNKTNGWRQPKVERFFHIHGLSSSFCFRTELNCSMNSFPITFIFVQSVVEHSLILRQDFSRQNGKVSMEMKLKRRRI